MIDFNRLKIGDSRNFHYLATEWHVEVEMDEKRGTH